MMLGLEDPFARRGDEGQEDSIHVPELCEHSRRALVRIEKEGSYAWDDKVDWEAWSSSGEVAVEITSSD